MDAAEREENKIEIRALVLGFLQQSLKENPYGFSVADFERFFPEKCEEPRDWYKRYKLKSTLEALECIKEDINLTFNHRANTHFVSLNMKSDKVDPHLIDLITNQKSSSKKTSRRPSSRALASFSLNRQYSGPHSRSGYNSRLNHGQQYRGENSFIKKSSPPLVSSRPSIYAKPLPTSSWMASGDPRNRGSSASMVPPQIKTPTPSQANLKPSVPQTRPPSVTSQPVPRFTSSVQQPEPTSKVKDKEQDEDPTLVQKKIYLRQRILSLLTRKFSEIKLLHLNSVYSIEYSENIDPAAYGHKNFTNLMQDSHLSEHIQINYKPPFVTVSARKRAQLEGKENVASRQGNSTDSSTMNNTSDKSNKISTTEAKFEAVDTFNLKTMIQSLEPLGSVKEPQPNNLEIEDTVKYRTVRMIFKSPGSSLKLEDWLVKFEQESRVRIRISDYGCRTLLEFFKRLAKDLPIDVQLNRDDEWVAVADIGSLSEWLNKKLLDGHYRAVTSIESRYEQIAFPNDTYTYTESKDLMSAEYHPAFILSVKRSNSLWIQLRTPRKIEEHLSVEASMTCYEGYSGMSLLKVPKAFVKPGFPCAVFESTQQRWCRALILKASPTIEQNEEVTALLVDYGITRSYAISQLSCLVRKHLKLPVGPIYSRLSGIRDECSLSLQQRAKMILQEYTSPPVTLACKFLAAIPSQEPDYLPRSCFEVKLVDTRHGKDCNLSDDINLPRDIEGEEW